MTFCQGAKGNNSQSTRTLLWPQWSGQTGKQNRRQGVTGKLVLLRSHQLHNLLLTLSSFFLCNSVFLKWSLWRGAGGKVRGGGKQLGTHPPTDGTRDPALSPAQDPQEPARLGRLTGDIPGEPSQPQPQPEGSRVRVLTMNAFFSSTVWNRPWPNLEVVSMNLRSIFSRARRLVCTSKDCGPRGKGQLQFTGPSSARAEDRQSQSQPRQSPEEPPPAPPLL